MSSIVTPPPFSTLGSRARIMVAAIAGYIAAGAVFGGYGLLTDPEGLGLETAWLDGSPFSSYQLPGIVLLVVIGGGMAATALLAIVGSKYAALAAYVMGIVLVAWGTVETVTVGYQGWQQLVLLGVFVIAPAAALMLLAGATRDDRS